MLRIIGLQEKIEGLFSRDFHLRLPDVVKRWLGFSQRRIRQANQYVHGFVHPAALLMRLNIDFFQGRPTPSVP